MKLIYWPDPTLSIKSQPVTKAIDPEIIAEMFGIMKSNNGVGLSAIQVGIDQRFFIMETASTGRLVIINPIIIERIGNRVPMIEGCLSLPGIYEKVSRYPSVKVAYRDDNMNTYEAVFTDQAAHIFQHEYEHLDGDLYIKHLAPGRKDAIRSILKKQPKRKSHGTS